MSQYLISIRILLIIETYYETELLFHLAVKASKGCLAAYVV